MGDSFFRPIATQHLHKAFSGSLANCYNTCKKLFLTGHAFSNLPFFLLMDRAKIGIVSNKVDF
jgi:hypothetical protein